jgi:hypothetical protein
MINNVFSTASRPAYLAMPTSSASDATWLRDRIEFLGGVSVISGAAKGDVCPATADVHTFPGLPAWSPPI